MLSPDYAIAGAYHAGSWPTALVIDGQGIVRFHAVGAFSRNRGLEAILTKLAKAAYELPAKEDIVCRDGVCTIAAKAATGEREWLPAMAAAPDGRVFLSYTANRNGNDDIYLREYDGKKWLREKPVTRKESNDYASSMVVDHQGRLWLAWCANADNKYDIYVRCYDQGRFSPPMRVTRSRDDAMAPKLTIAADGKLWLVFYQWEPWGKLSRDREVYARFYARGSWSAPIHISPAEVPRYEDHTDPAICASSSGNVHVVWSWDYHPGPASGNYDASAPTIFMRSLASNGQKQAVKLIGTIGKSKHCVDLTPAIACDGEGKPWILWDMAQARSGKHYISARDLEQNNATILGGPYAQICSPTLIKKNDGGLEALWSARIDNQWQIYRSPLQGKEWGECQPIKAGDGRRFPVAVYDRQGRLWLALVQPCGSKFKIEVVIIR